MDLTWQQGLRANGRETYLVEEALITRDQFEALQPENLQKLEARIADLMEWNAKRGKDLEVAHERIGIGQKMRAYISFVLTGDEEFHDAQLAADQAKARIAELEHSNQRWFEEAKKAHKEAEILNDILQAGLLDHARLLEDIRFMREEYTPFGAQGCRLCVYDNGTFIRPCGFHRDLVERPHDTTE